ncbi:MAG: hypothetical protein KIS68_03135 [Bauldia sp.]|nr:hypothetical protein [Bauldia sp.]
MIQGPSDKGTAVVFEDDDIQVVHRDAGGGDLLVVTFSSLGMFGPGFASQADGSTYWGRGFLEKAGLSAVGFVAKAPHWFMTPGMADATRAVCDTTKRYRKAVAYGSSLGAFAALKFGRSSGCAVAVACGPQATLDNKRLPVPDLRYQQHYRAGLHRGMRIEARDVCQTAYVIFDPHCAEDRVHAAEIARAAPEVRCIEAYFAGHECVRIFGGTRPATELITAAADEDMAHLRALTDALRRSSPARAGTRTRRAAAPPRAG